MASPEKDYLPEDLSATWPAQKKTKTATDMDSLAIAAVVYIGQMSPNLYVSTDIVSRAEPFTRHSAVARKGSRTKLMVSGLQ